MFFTIAENELHMLSYLNTTATGFFSVGTYFLSNIISVIDQENFLLNSYKSIAFTLLFYILAFIAFKYGKNITKKIKEESTVIN